MLRYYSIIIRGENFLIGGEDRKLGFYASRFILAPSREKAIELGLKTIHDEYDRHVLNRDAPDKPRLYVDEVIEYVYTGEKVDTGSGASWYYEDEDVEDDDEYQDVLGPNKKDN